MGADCILAIDQGTTNTKALLVSSSGEVVTSAERPLRQYYLQPGWVEQDPNEIWGSVREAIDDCLREVEPHSIAAVAISNQRESAVLWDRSSGAPLGPSIGWQCRRTAAQCEQLRRQGLEPYIHERTGLTIDPLFSATKARWLLDHVADASSRARRGELCIGTIDSWLLWNLSGEKEHLCDASNAARTQLLNLYSVEWDPDLLEIFGIPPQVLPEIRPSSGVFGSTVATGRLPADVPIASMIGDSHAALFGQAGFIAGSIKATYGTGSSLMTLVPKPLMSQHGLSTTVAWLRDEVVYALEGNISVTGAAVQWFGEFLGLSDPAVGVSELAQTVTDTGGVYLVPAFLGLGAPHWCENARGVITGITRSTKAAHVARAVLEAIAFQVHDVFDVMQVETGRAFNVLLADGGATRNEFLMQFQADVLNLPVQRSISPYVSALGAAYLAGLAIRLWSSEAEIAALPRPTDRFEPSLDAARRDVYFAGWKHAMGCALFNQTHSAATV